MEMKIDIEVNLSFCYNFLFYFRQSFSGIRHVFYNPKLNEIIFFEPCNLQK